MQGLDQWHVVQSLEQELQAIVLRLELLNQQVQTDHANHLELMRHAARLHNDAVTFQAQVDNLTRERDRLLRKTEQATEHLASLDLELHELSQAEEALQARLAEARQRLTDQRQERDRLRQLHDDTGHSLADLRAERSGLAS